MGKKLTIYMIDGTEIGPRTVEIGNWVGKAIYSSRAALNALLLTRNEFDRPGIYCLKSSADKHGYQEKIYIGEAENLGKRLKQQLSERDFDEMICFTSKDELLTKTQVRFLESLLIQLAIEAKSSQIDNGTQPSIPKLHEADVSDMEYFLKNVKLILPLMGFRFLIADTVAHSIVQKEIKESRELYSIVSPTKKIKAKMYQSELGFIVLKGSQAKKHIAPSVNDTYKQLQKKLIETKIMVNDGEFLIFTEDTLFSSPSAAANIVLGRQTPGPLCWVNNNGENYKTVMEKSL